MCTGPETSPEEFAKEVEKEAIRMGLHRAAKTYFIMDGGTYLWNIYDVCFSVLAKGTLDFYHAVQHMNILSEYLFPKDQEAKKQWLDEHCHDLKHLGPANLLKTIEEIDFKSIRKREAKKIIKRESEYFRNHEEHMHYEKNEKLGIPIGSGAMESQCSQNQNRFKRRGQFWSDEGFSLALKTYVRYTNNELDYCYTHAA